VPDTTLDRIRCPAFSRVFPKNRCERATNGISPDIKKFFCKSVFHIKATPLWDGTIFGQVFGRGGMTKFSKWKVPLPGGQARRNKLLGTTQHCCAPRGLMLAPSEIRLHRAGPDPLADELTTLKSWRWADGMKRSSI